MMNTMHVIIYPFSYQLKRLMFYHVIFYFVSFETNEFNKNVFGTKNSPMVLNILINFYHRFLYLHNVYTNTSILLVCADH